jgi:hypothetical protein
MKKDQPQYSAEADEERGRTNMGYRVTRCTEEENESDR